MSFRTCLTVIGVLLGGLPAIAANAPPGGLLCAPFGPGGTWNLYQTSVTPLTWAKAQELAASTKDPKGGTDRKSVV